MRAGRVVRIFDEHRLAIDLGSEDGVQRRMRFGIYTPSDPVVDPETGEELGAYRRRKALVFADEVFERFAVVVPPTIRRRVSTPVEREAARSPLTSMLGGVRPEYTEEPGSLDVDDFSTKPLPTGSQISVGDLVEVDPRDDPGLTDDALDEVSP